MFLVRLSAPASLALLLSSASAQGPIVNPIPGPIAASTVSVHLTPIAVGLEAPNFGAADPLGGDIEGHSEINADNVGTCLAHRAKKFTAEDTKVNPGNSEPFDRLQHRR